MLKSIGRSEFFNNTSDGVFSGTRTNHDKVGADFANLGFNEIGNATHKRENKNNASHTNSDAKTGKERAGAIFLDGSLGKLEMSF